jgi:hypothetical protein
MFQGPHPKHETRAAMNLKSVSQADTDFCRSGGVQDRELGICMLLVFFIDIDGTDTLHILTQDLQSVSFPDG